MDGEFEISLAGAGEILAVMDYFEDAIGEMNRQGTNFAGWSTEFYPDRDYIAGIINKGVTYLLRYKGVICGTIALRSAESGGLWGGSGWLHDLPLNQVMSVHTLCTSPRVAGRHAGRTLLRFAESEARKRGMAALRLDVRRKNPPAIHLYESEGYVRCGECEPVPDIEGDKVFYLYEKYIGE
ncbi:MAG: GNAT family N-acetyltransferase [Eubacteriales bacterium]|nr:GNAT family N-acetyltransferase [Eubacteriales bacterium]MDD3883194.1 GNAT family N-acetyltransferase [Eubacteriales bacterium]MDD4513335.1 GNAT family N-acetyltransferase [Eubacteriales bacterium]